MTLYPCQKAFIRNRIESDDSDITSYRCETAGVTFFTELTHETVIRTMTDKVDECCKAFCGYITEY